LTDGQGQTPRQFEPVPPLVEETARQVVDAALKVHRALGPGLLESVYETCLARELRKRGLKVATQVKLPVTYDGVRLDAGLRLDMVVADCLIVEVKAAERVAPVHKAQLLTYLKLSGNRLGLLINFNVPRIKNGIRRVVL
jgi:GxxExxY protein